MGLLDTVASLAGGGKSRGAAALLPLLIEQLNKYPGGLSGVISSFQKGGLGEIVASWVGTGPNLPVSADQLKTVLDPGMLGQLSKASGQDTGSVLSILSMLLPQVIDKATPDGVAQPGQMIKAAGLPSSLSGLLGKLG